MRSSLAFLPILLFSTACSSSSGGAADGGTSSDPFVGTWNCNGSSTTTFSQPPNTPPSTANDAATAVITDDGTGNLTQVRTVEDAGITCTLHSKLNSDGKSTTLDMGQTCMSANGGTLSYTSGGATLTSPTTYTSSSTWSYSGMTATGKALVGTGSGMSTCTKM